MARAYPAGDTERYREGPLKLNTQLPVVRSTKAQVEGSGTPRGAVAESHTAAIPLAQSRPVDGQCDTAPVSTWLSASDRVRLASNLVADFGNQFQVGEYHAVLAQFGVVSERRPDSLFHILVNDADDDSIAALGHHFDLDVPEKPEPVAAGHTPLDVSGIDGYTELVSAETALRDVVRIAVPTWQNDFTADEIAKLESKRAEEDRRRDGIAVSHDLLDYTEIYALQKIINSHWDLVKPVLDDKKRTEVYLGIILDIRNTVGHSRPIFPSERLLLAGAAGQIRNQLARYRASADGPQRHYPSLASARDSMGNVAPSSPNFSGNYRPYGPPPPPTPRLDVGDTITFQLEGTDPRGRELVWRAHSIPSATSASFPEHYPMIAEARGDRVEIVWTVGENDVGEDRQVAIVLSNNGRYHRHRNTYDDGCVFRYHVNPPPDA